MAGNEGFKILEHDETGRDQEEVFLVLSGSATMVIDGTEHPLATGTFARVDPEPRRGALSRPCA